MVRYRTMLLIGLAAVGLVAVTTASIAYMMEPIINEIFINKDAERLYSLPLMIIGIFTVMAVATYGQHYILRAVGVKVTTDLQNQLYSRMVRSDLRYFYQETVGQSVSRFLTDAQLMREALATTAVALCKDTLTAVALIAVMFSKDWQMAAVAMVVLPVAALPMTKIGRLARKSSQNIQKTSGTLASFLSDTDRKSVV